MGGIWDKSCDIFEQAIVSTEDKTAGDDSYRFDFDEIVAALKRQPDVTEEVFQFLAQRLLQASADMEEETLTKQAQRMLQTQIGYVEEGAFAMYYTDDSVEMVGELPNGMQLIVKRKKWEAE